MTKQASGKMPRAKKQAYNERLLPVKRSINLAEAVDKGIKWSRALPMIILIVVLAALLSKFAVIDRLNAVYRAQDRAASLSTQLEVSRAKIESYGDLSERYAHYTYAGMTQEELSRSDRTAVVSLIERLVMPRASVDSWSVNGNLLTINLTGNSLQDVNLIAQQLESDDMVSFCTVTAAATNDSGAAEPGTVHSNLVVYLNPADWGAAASSAAPQETEVPLP